MYIKLPYALKTSSIWLQDAHGTLICTLLYAKLAPPPMKSMVNKNQKRFIGHWKICAATTESAFKQTIFPLSANIETVKLKVKRKNENKGNCNNAIT